MSAFALKEEGLSFMIFTEKKLRNSSNSSYKIQKKNVVGKYTLAHETAMNISIDFST